MLWKAQANWRQKLRDEKGSVSAEFAITIMAVLLVLALIVGAISVGAKKLTRTAQAAEIARLEARGDDLAAQQLLKNLGSAKVQRLREGELLCVTISDKGNGRLLAFYSFSVRSCAAVIPEMTEGDTG